MTFKMANSQLKLHIDYNKQILSRPDIYPNSFSVLVEFACYPCVSADSLQVPRLPPTFKDMHSGIISKSTVGVVLSVGMNEIHCLPMWLRDKLGNHS